ncbi:right-handed parallel beta-helix repeat-containing protein [Nonomuraea longicatena]|uniref:Right-handed parallel beta-helix repeat-containing protein n=1 Tax=Nonomuraea longicatena TaxID=83682 RepID=A0ABP3ZNQ5_9ACTN
MLFVDPSGDDSGPGTIERPFATLDRARRSATPGTVVNLRAGVHRLSDTFRLGADDSGVVYQAYGFGTAVQEEVVVSGGRPVTGWQPGADGVHRAELPGPLIRQLYVADRRTPRASIALDHGLSRTETGYVTDHPAPATWTGQVEFVYRSVYPWSEARLQASAISGEGVTMAQPAFGWAAKLYHAVMPWEGETYGADRPTSAENSPAFLTEGTFAHADGVLHLKPNAGETPGAGAPGAGAEPGAGASAAGQESGSGELPVAGVAPSTVAGVVPSTVVVPVLETILYAEGATDLAFRGITFAEATWRRPSTPEGFLHYHGNGYYDGGEIKVVTFAEGEASVAVPGDDVAIPGNVVVEGCSRVVFEGCRFTRMGAVALEFRGAGEDNVLRDSEIDDVSAGGLVIGAGARTHRIENNRVHHVGVEYHGSPAVLMAGTTGTVVADNEIADVPHNGIVVYKGSGAQILDNLVTRSMSTLADGGGIYLSEEQDGAVVRGNAVLDTLTPYNFALYADYGAADITFEGNVVRRADQPVVLEVWPPLKNVSFIGNFFDKAPAPLGAEWSETEADTEAGPETEDAAKSIVIPEGVIFTGNVVGDDPRAEAIIDRAGCR